MKHPIQHFEAMKWQDKVFAIGEIVFLVGLIPSLLSDHKPAALTSFTTAAMLYSFLAVYASYGLWVTFVLGAITASIWAALGFQVALA